MHFINKILVEALTELPKEVKKLKNNNGHWKDIDVNTIFKNKYSQKLRNKWKALEEKFYNTGGRKKYGAFFIKTGSEKRLINVKDIYPGQTGVEGAALLKILNDETDHKSSSELPEAIRIPLDGKFYIVLVDGHHRVAADILQGKEQVEVLLKTENFW